MAKGPERVQESLSCPRASGWLSDNASFPTVRSCMMKWPQDLQTCPIQPRLLPDILLNASDKDRVSIPHRVEFSVVLPQRPEKPQNYCKE